MATANLNPQIQHPLSKAPAYQLLLWFFSLWPIYTTVNTKTMDKETIGKRIKSARLLRGLTMDELIARMTHKVSKITISRYERGAMTPRLEVLDDLAKALKLELAYFLKPHTFEVKDVKYRTKGELGAKALDSVKERAVDLMERYLEAEKLLRLAGDFNHPLPDYTISKAEEAEQAAYDWLKAWNLGYRGLTNIYGILEAHHIKVAELDEVDEAFDGLAIMINGSIPIIVINKAMTIERRRYTALHELAHLLLKFDQKMSNDEQEKACHRFAGSALMPRSLLYELLDKERDAIFLKELIEIKELYGISIQALMYRAEEYGIISYRRHLNFKSWIADNKKEKNLGNYTGKEETDRFELLVLKALDGEKITLAKAAELLRAPMQELKEKIKESF